MNKDGKELLALRHMAGMGQNELGERLNIGQPAVSRIERGETKCRPDVRLRWVAACTGKTRLPRGTPSELILSVAAKGDTKLRGEARLLAKHVDEDAFELARVLFRIRSGHTSEERPIYESWGFDSFGAYASKELNMAPSVASAMARVHGKFVVEFGVSTQTLPSMSKLRVLLPVATCLSNVKHWLAMAQKLGYTDLRTAVASRQGHTPSSYMSVMFDTAQVRENVRAVLIQAMSLPGVTTFGQALDRIARDWKLSATKGYKNDNVKLLKPVKGKKKAA
jgi:transcriptional regulator with XRE-family HTH domain